MEGTRVYVPHPRLVWVPATVLSVDDRGQRFSVRLDALPRDEHGENAVENENEEGEECTIDLRQRGMPHTLPLENSVADLAMQAPTHRKFDANAQMDATQAMGEAIVKASANTGVEDMCDLHHLHEPAIVYNMRARFEQRVPYTYTGKIVVAVNPYEWIAPLYSETVRDVYTKYPREALPPHVYATSAEAFRNMKTDKMPQSILVSGESGAGKTETVKIMMEHLASISVANAIANEQKNKDKHLAPLTENAQAQVQGHHRTIVEKVLKSNPLLEAFGNAKTIRNDNSSRFGKFTQLQFNTNYCLIGAECRHYLLEKSRVVDQAPGERNYHIFYQLVSAHESQYGFTETSSPKDFRYLRDEAVLLSGQSDKERYQVTRDALSIVGVGSDEQEQLFRAMGGILHLGQLEFVSMGSDKDSSQPMASTSPTADCPSETIEYQQREIKMCADLLGVELKTLCQKLCSRTVRARQEVYSVPLSALQAGNNRDALAKELYARLFAYLVSRVNQSISGTSQSGKTPSYLHIDLLDIFGFESFTHNSFEQFCINYANEKLQQKFTMDVFKTVQEEYASENVGWEFVKFQDNQDMIDLLENSMGVMALLNEECVRPKGSDVSFVSKMSTLHDSHRRFEKARLSPTQFLLRHYAGAVTYDAEGFVEKNRDSLQSDLIELLAVSDNGLIAGVFGARDSGVFADADLAGVFASMNMEEERRSVTGGFKFRSSSIIDDGSRASIVGRGSIVGRRPGTFMQETVSYKFKAQLAVLMSDISATEVHYVRCIKPNSKKSPKFYEIASVVNQLRCAGVVEAIRITRAAFPNKMSHEKFLRRFMLLRKDYEALSPFSSLEKACDLLIKSLLGDEDTAASESQSAPKYVVGKTMIYFGKDVLEGLEQRRMLFVHESATKIQKCALRWMMRHRFVKLRLAVSKLQAIQKRKLEERAYAKQRKSCIQIQSLWRGVRSRRQADYLVKMLMATKIQSACRSHIARRKFVTVIRAVVKLQATIKMHNQGIKYKRMLEEHKEQTQMENEVAMLQRRLEEEKRARQEIEQQNSTLQQELHDVRLSSAQQVEPAEIPTRHRSTTIEREVDEESKLLDDSERVIDYLKKELIKCRELIAALNFENENLKAENKKVKEAYQAAGASFAALNQHNKQQSKANLRLMSTHAALIKSQEEKMKKYQKQISDLKEDLKMQRSVYQAELMARVQQQDLLVEMVRLSESYGVPDELLEKMRSMIELSKPVYKQPFTRQVSGGSSRGSRKERSDTTESFTVSQSGSQSGSMSGSQQGSKFQFHRRATIDSVLMNPPLRTNLVDAVYGRPSGVPDGWRSQERNTYTNDGRDNRSSMFMDPEGHRHSRIGGMFKKMFRNKEHPDDD